MSNEIIKSIFDRFPYLSVDVLASNLPDHPQVIYREHNSVNDEHAGAFSAELENLAHKWAAAVPTDSQFAGALNGLRQMVKAISATSLIMRHGEQLIVERPGFEVEKSRRGEVTALLDRVVGDWGGATASERLTVARLALLGLGPLQLELVNFLDVERVPHVLGRMISRLEGLVEKLPLERLPEMLGPSSTLRGRFGEGRGAGLSAIEVLEDFYGIEKRLLSAAGLVRTTIPGGTRPRVYVPASAMSIEENARLAAAEVLARGADRTDALASFLGMVWKDFGDEAFVALHESGEVNAVALVGGCIYTYKAAVLTDQPTAEVKNEGKPVFIRTAGPFEPREWRRSFDRLCFEGGTTALREFRKSIIEVEKLPEELREREGSNGVIAKSAQRLLGRQINYNMSNVLNGNMERISADEWSPFMCRDRHGAIYNPGHALAGVGEMFRGLLEYGGRFSQFRSWREVDGTHGFADMRRFLGYKAALDSFLKASGPN